MTNFAFETLELLKVGERVTKKVVPTREAFFKEESGFGIYEVELEEGTIYTMKGTFPGSLTIGNTYEVEADVVMYRGETQLMPNTLTLLVLKRKERSFSICRP